jgi:hypothetical protein
MPCNITIEYIHLGLSFIIYHVNMVLIWSITLTNPYWKAFHVFFQVKKKKVDEQTTFSLLYLVMIIKQHNYNIIMLRMYMSDNASSIL